ncbi:unnamed protein product [Allacma fusca]|uniref:Attacin C-terminal domain-containing protein n=1 Tax=Allacma fusca TaxID=39272 RepID=A0A8J2KPL6_9HEXA|nr:unnamed protein product [Allacma fusca]
MTSKGSIFVIILVLCCLACVYCQVGELAQQAAQNAAASGDKFNFNANVNPQFTNGKNWNVASSIQAGSNFYRSKDIRHSLGAGLAATHNFGRHHGRHFNTRPNFGAALIYNYKFGKRR